VLDADPDRTDLELRLIRLSREAIGKLKEPTSFA
jgi:hypothetical protein